jgi:hypothetical protein
MPSRVTGMDDPTLYAKQLATYGQLEAIQAEALRRVDSGSVFLSPSRKQLLRKMLQLRLTPMTYQQLLSGGRIPVRDPLLSRAMHLAAVYYALADRRSVMFVHRAERQKTNAPCVMITGGYHTPLVTQLLRRKNKSYVVLTPRVTAPPHPSVYRQTLLSTYETLRRQR